MYRLHAPMVNALVFLLLSSRTLLPYLVWWCYHIQHSVTFNIYWWHRDKSAVCPGHPSATCVATHGRISRKHFFNRIMSGHIQQGCDRNSSAILLPYFSLRSPPLFSPEFKFEFWTAAERLASQKKISGKDLEYLYYLNISYFTLLLFSYKAHYYQRLLSYPNIIVKH